jgi:hypothetical protein
MMLMMMLLMNAQLRRRGSQRCDGRHVTDFMVE